MSVVLRTSSQLGDPDVTDALRRQFEPLVSALSERATMLVRGLPEPRPNPGDLVERVFHFLAAQRSVTDLEAAARRHLETVVDNLAIRAALQANDFDTVFARLQPRLERWAAVLVRGLPAPQPDVGDVVNEVFIKLRRAPLFSEVDSPIGYANRTVKNLVVDLARKRGREIVAEIDERDLPRSELEHSTARLEAIIRKAGLDPLEICMLTRVVFERLAVPTAQRECGGPRGDPYYALEKIFDKVASALGLDRRSAS